MKCAVLQIITIICVTHLQKNFWIWTSIKQLLTKYQIFMKLPQIPHIHINRNFSSIFVTFLDQLLHPYKFHGSDMSGILFFIFASCEPSIYFFDETISCALKRFIVTQTMQILEFVNLNLHTIHSSALIKPKGAQTIIAV